MSRSCAVDGTKAKPAVEGAGSMSRGCYRRSEPHSRVADAGVAELFVSHRAEVDLREIWRYIAADNPAAADRVLLRIDERMQVLKRFPRIGALRNDIRRG